MDVGYTRLAQAKGSGLFPLMLNFEGLLMHMPDDAITVWLEQMKVGDRDGVSELFDR